MNFTIVKDRQVLSLIVVLGVIAVFIGFAGFSFLRIQENTFRQAELDNLQLIGQRNAVMLGNWINERKTDTRLMASNPELAEKLSNYLQNRYTRIDSSYIADRMNAYYTQKKYQNAFITDLSGKVLFSLFSYAEFGEIHINNDWAMAITTSNVKMGDIKRSELSPQDIVLDFYTPIYMDTKKQ
ncbi:MAG: hypothetical protein PHO32_04640, partial [Candidatus Cloacimonetes bacterium]|nr:hypothetical protein [Candidatus Cloacimonadota bacterium]